MQSQKLALMSLGGRVTLFYLRQINELFQQKFGDNMLCPLVLKKTNFDTLNGNLKNRLYESASSIEFHDDSLKGAEKLIIPSITLHSALDRLPNRDAITYSVVHPIETTIAKLVSADCDRVVLFTSQYGLNSDYLSSFFKQVGIEVLLPNQEQQAVIDKVRHNIDTYSEKNDDSKDFLELLSNYSQDHTVVIACAQLSLLLPHAKNNIFDMAQIQINEALTVYD